MICDGRRKLVFENGGGTYRFCDRRADLGETHDLASVRPNRVKRLRQRYTSETKH